MPQNDQSQVSITYPMLPKELWKQIFDFALNNQFSNFSLGWQRIAKFTNVIIQELSQEFFSKYFTKPSQVISRTKTLFPEKSTPQLLYRHLCLEGERLIHCKKEEYAQININNDFAKLVQKYRLGKSTPADLSKTSFTDILNSKQNILSKEYLILPKYFEVTQGNEAQLIGDPIFNHNIECMVRARSFEHLQIFCDWFHANNTTLYSHILNAVHRLIVSFYTPMEFIQIASILPIDLNYKVTKSSIHLDDRSNRTGETHKIYSLSEYAKEKGNHELAKYLEAQTLQENTAPQMGR